jgi:hypothetical protein
MNGQKIVSMGLRGERQERGTRKEVKGERR